MNPEFDDEDEILEQLADRLNLSGENRERYIDLQRIPGGLRTPEVQESIERLVFIGQGIPEDDIEEFQRIKCIPVAERTLAELEFVFDTIIASSRASHPKEWEHSIPDPPLVRERIRTLFNHLSVFPQPVNNPAYNQLIKRLDADVEDARDSEV